jgi:tRNA-dihydrouridine synthase
MALYSSLGYLNLMTPGANYLQRPLLRGQVNFPLCLAPMVGLSHIALRLLVQRYTPDGACTPWPTEMLSTWRLPKEDLGATPETLRADEFPLVPQILGNEEEPIRESVAKLVDWGAAGIDINMGCPVKKALRHNYGVALMGDADYAAEVVRMTVRHSSVPVSVKLRAGLQKDEDFLLRFVRGLEEAGAAWITLHPRVGEQKRRGAADWSQIGRVREAVGLPVIGNGDVQCAEDVFAMLAGTGCDAVMAGRALAARPWLMWQVGERLGFAAPVAFRGQAAPNDPESEGVEYGRACLFLLDALERYFDFEGGAKRFRFHLRMTSGWLEFGHALGAKAARGQTYADLRATVEEFFAVPQRMFSRTQLRE